jgi:Sulfotransferase domain
MLLMLWSAPRSRSTAFFRMMAERGDFTVVHEPFSYLAEFGYADVAGARVRSAAELLAALGDLASRGAVFAKETTGRRYPEVLAEPDFLATAAVHTFLIRHPRETIASYHTMNPDAPAEKMGFESLHEIFTAVARLTGRTPVVMDAADLMRRPSEIVAAYCARVGIPFLPEALRWQPAQRPEWELSSRWHAGVAASAGLGDSASARRYVLDVAGHPVLGEYLRYHLPYYEMLHARRLTALRAGPAALPCRTSPLSG